MNGRIEADAAPAHAKQEVHGISDREQLDGTASVHRLSISIGIAEIDIASCVSVCVAYSHQCEYHLDEEYQCGQQCDGPVGTLGRFQLCVPINKAVHICVLL